MLRVFESWAMTRFAAYALFAYMRPTRRPECNRASRVAFEASGNAGSGVSRLIEQSGGLRQRGWMNRVLARGGSPGAQGGVVSGVMFYIPILVHLADECYCLPACAEGPFHRQIHH